MDQLLQKKLVDSIRQALKYREDPAIICSRSRVTCEALLSSVWQKEFGDYPSGLMFQALADGIIKKKPALIPAGIQKLLGTIQHFGNYSSHAQVNLEELDESHASMVEAALTRIAHWFFVEYLEFKPAPDFKPAKDAEQAQSTTYQQLFTSMLEDNMFELDEYEKLVEIRKSLQLSKEDYKSIEKEVILQKFGRSVESVREILKPGDLNTFKRKYESRGYDFPEWLTRAFFDMKNDTTLSEGYRELLTYFLQPDQTVLKASHPRPISLLGCWLGWYSQYNMKTFYDLFFIATSDSSFVGLTYEPVNPNWFNEIGEEGELIVATLSGQISAEEIVSFTKKYVFENSWEIDYTGVVLDQGQYFEGEWEIKELSGSFNATKTKALLPVHIYDTEDNRPITKITHLDKRRDLTGSWFLRLAGKETSYMLLHLLSHDGVVEANVVYFEEGRTEYQYLKGTFDGVERIMIEKVVEFEKGGPFLNMRFTIDWVAHEISGTTKETRFALRSLKGYKI